MPTLAKPSKPLITNEEYSARRQRVLKELGGAVGIVFSGEGPGPAIGKFKSDASFRYLTGLESELGAAVLFDPTAEDPKRRITLFLRPIDPEIDRWDGYREMIGEPLRKRTGFATVVRTAYLGRVLGVAARRAKKLACLHPFAAHTASSVSPDLAVFRKLQEKIPGVGIEDRTMLLPELRAVKSPAEVELMKRAAAATAAGYRAAFATLEPGVGEREMQHAMERAYIDSGAEGVAYGSIVGSGLNGTVLHYADNDGECRDGDVLVIDSGAQFCGYACDVTRTLPVSGKFSKDQRDLYSIVLKAQLAAIKAAKPGALMWEVDKAARDIIEKAGVGDAYIHGIGHQLGLEVHDITPDGALKPGMVITIEPGVYLPDRRIGIRIEDDILITKSGNTNLTEVIPKTIEDIEAAMRR
jgi:Xaa-Pro aminopeptidase